MTTQGMITFEYAGSQVVFDPAAKMWNLTEMHQASGSPRQKGPSFWLNGQQAKDLIAALEVRETTGNSCSLVETREGRNGGTWAHWQIAAAYAHYLRPDFYLQWNEWALERAQQIATGDGAAPLAWVAALEERVANLEGRARHPAKPNNGPRRLAPRQPFNVTVAEILETIRTLGGSADLYQLRLALPHIGYHALRGNLYRMVARNLVRRPYDGHYESLPREA